MSRRSQVFAICDSQMCLRMPQILKFSCRMHPRLEIRRPGAIFSRRSARASWAWARATRFSFTCCVADDLSGLLNDAQRLVITCWMLHWLVTISCHTAAAGGSNWKDVSLMLWLENLCLPSWIKVIRILFLQWLFAYCFSGAADWGWGRVLRTPPPLLLWKGSATSPSVDQRCT